MQKLKYLNVNMLYEIFILKNTILKLYCHILVDLLIKIYN